MGPQNNEETNPMQEEISPSNHVDETTQHQPKLEGNQPPINQPPKPTTSTQSTWVQTQSQQTIQSSFLPRKPCRTVIQSSSSFSGPISQRNSERR